MKNLIVIQFLFISMVFSQSNEIKEALKYYPVHIGDYWQYRVTRSPFGIQDSSWIGYKEIVGDTIMQNGKKYFIIKEDRLPIEKYYKPYYVRIDSSTANVYKYTPNGQEILIDSLLAKKGDVVINGYKCTKDTLKEYFGAKVNTKTIEPYLISSTSYNGWERAKEFGEVMRYYEDIFVYYIRYQCDVIYVKIDGNEYGIKTNISNGNIIPKEFTLSQNYPNPFNPVTKINFTIFQRTNIRLNIYDVKGSKIYTLLSGEYMPGKYFVDFNASNLSSGIYFYQLKTSDGIITKKMLLLK
ncbi:MAG: T9SS type A sorting domain-containing protein [Stygiobacter sp.]